jgi:hypothetical protein
MEITSMCEYGKINRDCDGTACKVCEREDILQAMNDDAFDRKYRADEFPENEEGY